MASLPQSIPPRRASAPLSLVPVEGEAATPATAPESSLIASWPAPPLSPWASGALTAGPEPVEIELADGGTLTGAVVEWIPGARAIVVRGAGNAARPVDLATVTLVRLTRALELAVAPGHAWGDALRKYTLAIVNGSTCHGETAGEVRTAEGLFLYPPMSPGRVHRLFVPAARVARFETAARATLKLSLEDLEVPGDPPLATPAPGAASAPAVRTERLTTPDEVRAAFSLAREGPIRRLGQVLMEAKLITQEQLDAALAAQKRQPRRLLGEFLIEMGAVRPEQMRKLLTQKLGIPSVDVGRFEIEPAVTPLVPQPVSMRHKLIPLFLEGDAIVVAMDNPLSSEALEAVRFSSGRGKVIPTVAPWPEIRAVLGRMGMSFFATGDAVPVMAKGEPAPVSPSPMSDGGFEFDLSGVEELTSRLTSEITAHREEEKDDTVRESDSTLVRLVNKIILDAYESGASDIHIEPAPGKQPTRIRVRRDGALSDYAEVPSKFRSALVSRIKIMATLDIAERRKPQDGKIDFSKFGPARLELRVATIPTNNGLESVILRLLAAHEPVPPEKLGLDDQVLEQLRTLTSKPHGLLLVCGPTGSGKTTTLHSLISMINTPERKIWTAEDPIEITQQGLSQVQVNAKIGWTFADALRSFLRADPDVIMVGEMRDAETASMGVEASLTGHLVMSTLHTNSAPETVTRLLDLGVDPFNFGDALLGVLAQRLVRRVCGACAKRTTLGAEDAQRLAAEYCHDTPLDPKEVLAGWMSRHAEGGRLTLAHAEGCEACGGTGLKGRLGVHEFMQSTPALRALVQSRAPVSELRREAIVAGMRTLKQDGIEKALKGLTTLDQVRGACA